MSAAVKARPFAPIVMDLSQGSESWLAWRQTASIQKGMRFGQLTVIGLTKRWANARYFHYICQCDCGGTTEARAFELRQGLRVDCGCPSTIEGLPGEAWAIASFRGAVYRVSSLGRVQRLSTGRGARPGSLLKPYATSKGYLLVDIAGYTIPLHKLIAEAFLGMRPVGYQINHKDGNKRNNAASNLEYITAEANIAHAVKMGLTASGERCGNAKLNANDIRAIRQALTTSSASVRSIARRFGVHHKTISSIASGKTWKSIT